MDDGQPKIGLSQLNADQERNCQVSTVQCQLNKDTYRLLCKTEKSIPLFSRDWWLDIVCGETNWEVLIIEQKGRVLAALPFYILHTGIISMPPYTQTMGPWFAPESEDTKYTTVLSKRQNLCKEFVVELRKYSYFLQNFNYQITDWLPFYWNGYKQTTRYTYILPEISNQDTLWENMSQHIRRNITKAKDKSKIIVKKGISTEEFISVFKQTFKRQGETPQDLKIIESLISSSREREQGDLWGGYDESGRLHAVVFMVWQQSSAYYLAGGGDPEVRDSGAHSYVMWECIRYASERSECFDFEGSMLPGVERFFRDFGAVQTPYFTITKGNLSLLHRGWLKLKKIL